MNNNRKHYIKKETRGQIIFIVCILLAIIIGLAWTIIEDMNDGPEWKPAAVYPMANAHISWEQTYRPGGWENAGT